ncbi:MAG: hypothetical protein M3235_19275 [Actinomycetota bacterium]|nr:hypothetical protein [Actinomycetota bacterium]
MSEHPPGPSAPAGTTIGTRLAVLAVAVVVGLLAAPVATHTWQATAVTGAIGLVAAASVVAGRPRRVGGAVRLPRSAAAWFVLFGVITVLELGALAWGDRPSFPTVSWLLGPYFVEPAVRFAGYVVWICAGWWLVRR